MDAGPPDVSDESLDGWRAKREKMERIVAQTPGAAVFTDGMKMPGQQEREEAEAEWMRGEFDPIGDLVVSGRRMERGEGRTADGPTGPQPGAMDDLLITLRGTPVVGAQDVFFAPRGDEGCLASRDETQWLIELTNPRLSEHWRRALSAMSRGDVCRFTCAAKKAQSWLQCLADCCEPPDGGTSTDADAHLAIPAGRVAVCCWRLACWRLLEVVFLRAPTAPLIATAKRRLEGVGGNQL